MRCELPLKDDWKSTTLGSVCNITSSKRIFAKEYQTSGIPFYRGKEIIEKHKGNSISTELFISPERFCEIKKKFGVPEIGDILLTSVGTLGIPWLVDETDFYFKDGNLTWLRCSDKVLNKYLYLWLNSPEAQHQIDAKCIGSTQKALTIESLNKFEISLPPIFTQERICSVLYPILDKIELNQRINDNLERQVSIVFGERFVDFTYANGTAPDGWRQGVLGDVADITSGKRPTMKQTYPSSNVTIPLVGAATIMGYTNQALYSEPILVTGRVGTHGVVQRFQTPCWASDNTLVIKSLYYEFVHQVLKRVNYTNMNRGSTQPLITQTDLKNVHIIFPAVESLQEFETWAGSLMALYESNRIENARLAELRDNLIPQLMSGKIDISNI